MSRDTAKINQHLIEGRFGHVRLCQLHTKLSSAAFCMQVMKAYVAETSYIQLLIDFATSLLTIHLPVLNNAAVSLYDMGEGEAQIRECSGMA